MRLRGKAMNAVALQRMRRIEHALNFLLPVAIFALGDEAPRANSR